MQTGRYLRGVFVCEGINWIIKEAGKGAYGRVYLATPKDSTKLLRAIKVINKAQIKYPITFINEIEILKKLDHPNIIKIY